MLFIFCRLFLRNYIYKFEPLFHCIFYESMELNHSSQNILIKKIAMHPLDVVKRFIRGTLLKEEKKENSNNRMKIEITYIM